MKLKRTYRLVRSLLLIGLLASGSEAYAAHSQRTEYGVVQTVDYTTKSFTIIPDKRTNAITFIWNGGTGFRQKSPKPGANWISRLFSLGEKNTADSLQPGRKVRETPPTHSSLVAKCGSIIEKSMGVWSRIGSRF